MKITVEKNLFLVRQQFLLVHPSPYHLCLRQIFGVSGNLSKKEKRNIFTYGLIVYYSNVFISRLNILNNKGRSLFGCKFLTRSVHPGLIQ